MGAGNGMGRFVRLSLMWIAMEMFGLTGVGAFAPQWVSLQDALATHDAGPAVVAPCPYGQMPAGWTDLTYERPSRNWGGDAGGALRLLEKNRVGVLAQTRKPAGEELIAIAFSKTEDAAVTVGVALRVAGKGDDCALVLSGANELQLYSRKNDAAVLLSSLVSARPYHAGERWHLVLRAKGAELSGGVFDQEGRALGQVDAVETTHTAGVAGVIASEFVAILSIKTGELGKERFENPNPQADAAYQGYEVLAPDMQAGDRMRKKIAAVQSRYDLAIAGAGTGGACAAIQAARQGCSVLLIEETDWIGGQMSAAAVTSMDEGHVDLNNQDRERGLYREFQEGMRLYYYGLNKSPWQAYYEYLSPRRQEHGGYEPHVTQALLYTLLEDAARRGKTRVDVLARHKVVSVTKKGKRATGVCVTGSLGHGEQKKIECRMLMDATEYGDMLPLTGARYRAGNSISPTLNLEATPQDNTWPGVLREYTAGIPEDLQITSKPPNYEEYRKGFAGYVREGLFELTPGRRMWRGYFAWRGMADSVGPLLGRASENRHSRCGINGGNDCATTVRGMEDSETRRKEELGGIYRTLSALYYFQHEVGVNWSLATDEGYATEYNRENMKRLGVAPEFHALAIHLPQRPYTRESRRVIGVKTLRAAQITRFESAINQPHAAAIGDYGVDLHRTAEFIEHDLDRDDYDHRGGPFQIPLEVFVPEKIDGLLVAEKNLSQSRIVSGATRLQPVTMLTGQAAGALAAVSLRRGVQPRDVNVLDVQDTLLRSGSTLAARWHRDVPWGSEAWRAVQLLSLYQIWDVPAPLSPPPARLGTQVDWGWEKPCGEAEAVSVCKRLGAVVHKAVTPHALGFEQDGTRGDFALNCAAYLLKRGHERLHEDQP